MGTYFLHPKSVRQLFDQIAPRYDFLNHLLSLRRDVRWRSIAVRELKGVGGWILDMATGTGEIAIEILRQNRGSGKVAGVDFSGPMLQGARRKILRKNLTDTIGLSQGDGIALPFRNNTFSGTIIAFGLRNILRKDQALSEMVRVTRNGGKVIILEFTLPKRGPVGILYPLYFTKILPWMGGLISGNRGAYDYLPQSVSPFRSSGTYEDLMRKAGLEQVRSRKLTFGIASLMVGVKKTS
jgi:demethylmenaquinone methyltransferase / 2-methoxy-6-polyprenyl-1,4-benzoquinol methylase